MIGVGAGYLVLLIVEQILTNSGHSHSHGTRHRTPHAHTRRTRTRGTRSPCGCIELDSTRHAAADQRSRRAPRIGGNPRTCVSAYIENSSLPRCPACAPPTWAQRSLNCRISHLAGALARRPTRGRQRGIAVRVLLHGGPRRPRPPLSRTSRPHSTRTRTTAHARARRSRSLREDAPGRRICDGRSL
jgi:hypothetical protein